jgi:hypothetical protein
MFYIGDTMAIIYWRPRLKIFSSTDRKVSYDNALEKVYSYSTVIGLKYGDSVLLTDYNYSRTTNKHYDSIISFFKKNDKFKDKNIKIYRIPCKLKEHYAIQEYTKALRTELNDLSISLKRKRTAWSIDNVSYKIHKYKETLLFLENMLAVTEIENMLRS